MLNPAHVLTAAQMRVRLFLRAMVMSVLQASGVWLIAHGSLFAGVTGFLISYHWSGSTRDVADYRVPYSRMWYALGGALGTLVALLVSQGLHRMHLL